MRTDKPGGQGLGVGSMTELAERMGAGPATTRANHVLRVRLLEQDSRRRDQDAKYQALVERVAAVAGKADPRDALLHLVAELEAERAAKERR